MFSKRFQELSSAMSSCVFSASQQSIDENQALLLAIQMISETRRQKGIVYVIGNGGSIGIASHFSMELIKTLQVPSQTLFDSNLLTALANDFGYEKTFSYPLEHLLKPQDLLVAISSSGKSANIVRAAETAISKDAALITLSGYSEQNPLRKLGDLNFWTNRSDSGIVEISHFFLLHAIIDLWNKRTEKTLLESKA